MTNSLPVSFACKEMGCSGIVANDPGSRIAVKVGCASSSIAVCCPDCGRLYWFERQTPIHNRQFDKAFFANGDIENRPMNAHEKKMFIDEFIAATKSETEESDIGYIRDTLYTLIHKGHAADCPARDTIGECACGNSDAESWITRHPVDTVSVIV